LSGEVNTLFEKNRAERLVEGVKGVVGVRNNIETQYSWEWKPDWEILADVRDELEWSVFVEHGNINVSVDDGIVTLTGMVDSWSEYDEAEKNAFQGGAKDVINNLNVHYGYYGPSGPDYYYYGYNNPSISGK
jgi:osmotically-inducible protein OsmY